MIKVIRAKDNDVFGIQSVANQLLPKTYNDIMTTEEIDYLVDVMYSKENNTDIDSNQDITYFVAIDNDKCVGFVSLHRAGPNLYHLSKIFVQLGRQNEGIGTLLFDNVLSYIRELHVTNTNVDIEVYLSKENKAKSFYKSLGMVKVRDSDFDIGNGFVLQQDVMSLNYKCA